MDWKKYGYVISSKYRKKILNVLMEHPKTPKHVAIESGLHFSHVSKTLNELQELHIVVCLNPQLRRGRIYDLTEEGKEIAKQLQKQTLP